MRIIPDPQQEKAIKLIGQIVGAVTRPDNLASWAIQPTTDQTRQQKVEAMELIRRLSVLIPPRTASTIIVTQEELESMGIKIERKDARDDAE